ncbi:hypothetical protein [Deinococcus deserti]|uniref:Lipoprotein n=1 Tax=Deinococcus deserti (strain DSM 17065 / CIP 109153 / LMG 22923 / VCD115) TaxID=546414 RepID=C1CUH9_DEIDV|nr:hypothetical protein [Deinococcus deserti]ACO45846.1 conserved hypothetical protein, precursor [Deinococcus deserti VCD115]
MKKFLLAGVGMAGLLAGCGTNAVNLVDPVRNLRLLSYQSEYTLPSDYVDTKSGTTYSKGSSVICNNLNTVLEAVVRWDGMANRFGVQLEGRDTGTTKEVFSRAFNDIYSPAEGLALNVNVPPAMASLSLKNGTVSAQNINVRPVATFTVLGATFLNVVAQSSNGMLSNEAQSVQAIPVADCTL